MRYRWSRLNNFQKGSFGEHYAKMEFAQYGFLVFSSEVDDRGIDFVVRTEERRYFDVQVKTITGNNYTFISESKFSKDLLVCLIVLEEGIAPKTFLFSGSDWDKDTMGLLTERKGPAAKEAERGINLAKKRETELEKYKFDSVVSQFFSGNS